MCRSFPAVRAASRISSAATAPLVPYRFVSRRGTVGPARVPNRTNLRRGPARITATSNAAEYS